MLGRRLTRNVRLARKASEIESPAGRPFEPLEDRRLMSADPLAHVAKVQPLPYVLEFTAPVEGLHDKDGEDMANDNGTDNENDDGDKSADDLEALGGGGFVWRREGGIAGFCDVVTASVDGEATVGTCATDPPAIQNRPTLTAAQEDELSGMVARLTSFTEVQKDPATADALTISIYFSGDGDAQPTDEDIAAIQALALEILASPPIQ